MTTPRFEFGQRVRSLRRPEWGIGSVMRAESARVDGTVCQRVQVRFPGVGIKTLLTTHADLELVPEGESGVGPFDEAPRPHALASADELAESGWLEKLARRKVDEIMTAIPERAKDPFVSLERRLEHTLDLYRFTKTGRGLIDWAIAQTGLDDPLTRFNRHELERYFDRWIAELDAHLVRILQEARAGGRTFDAVLAGAPDAARRVLRRSIAR